MTRYQAGDAAAATALIARVSPRLYRYFAAHAASRAHADDLLQDTWLRVHRVRRTYQPGAPVLPWVYAIARRVRIDHYRKFGRIASRVASLEAAADVASAPQRERDSLDSLLGGLPESQREVIELLKIAGMSLEEVARATSSTVGAVKQKAHRAYKKLRETLSRVSVKDDLEAYHEKRRRG